MLLGKNKMMNNLIFRLYCAFVIVLFVYGEWKLAAVESQKDEQSRAPDNGSVLPYPAQPFKGVIGRTVKDSKPDFPKPITAPKGAPNILLILTDDVGFGASSTFGGPIPTPTFDKLAQRGLRYNQFHTTALCSPTRAALLTGRNHHSVGTGNITELATGFPGYDSIIPKSAATVANILVNNGYNTSWFGKNHLIPDWLESSNGPFDQWASGLGFEYFFGFLGADTNQWHPALYEQNVPYLPPFNDPNYILITDLSNRAMKWIRTQKATQPDKPFFVYFSPGNSHTPHHAPKSWIAKFKGQFDQGWDKVREQTLDRQKKMGIVPANTELTPRPDGIVAWDSLSDEQKRLFARMMEVYAANVAQCDYEIGRVIDSLEEIGQLDNTLIVFIEGDNGASAEGTLQGTTNEVGEVAFPESLSFLVSMIDQLGSDKTYNHYPVGWAHAMDSPLQWMKQVASHFGGTRNGLVISWPNRIKNIGQIRSQFHHVIDIVPTILEAAKVPAPLVFNGVEQKPLEGVSMVYTFDDFKVPSRHTTQYFEILGNRAMYREGWIASTTPLRPPWVIMGPSPNPEDFPWELYHITEDFSQAHNLAKQHPEKLKELQDLFWVEAKKYHVLPLDTQLVERLDIAGRPSINKGRRDFTYYPGMIRITEGSAPDIKNKSFTITADVEIPENGAEGVLATQGGRFGGWGLLLLEGKPLFAYTATNQPEYRYRIQSDDKMVPGPHTIVFDFKYDGGGIGKGGTGTITIDGKEVAEGRIEHTIPFRISLDETFDVGMDTGTPVIDDYEGRMPFAFTGTLKNVKIHLGDEKLTSEEQMEIYKINQKIAQRCQ
jgi:arylsulfatase A-like enzyme